MNGLDDAVWLVRCEQFIAQFHVPQQATDPGENGEVLLDRRCHQHEEKPGWRSIHGAVGNSLLMTSENDDGSIHDARKRVACMGQSNPATDAGTMKLLTFAQGAQ